MRKKSGSTQDELGAVFGIDQSNVNRSLAVSNAILSEILPTARKMTEILRKIKSLMELKSMIPPAELAGNRIAVVLDDTHVPVDRSGNKERRKADYSGKKKRFTLNTNVITDTRKRILWIGTMAPGSAHDFSLLKEDPPDLGILTETMSRDGVSERDRPPSTSTRDTREYRGTIREPQ